MTTILHGIALLGAMLGTPGLVASVTFCLGLALVHTRQQKLHLPKWVSAGVPLAALVLSMGVKTAAAGGFGIAGLDAFLTTFAQGVTGLGITVGGVGLVGYVGSVMDNPFSTILSGSINFFTKAAATRGRMMNCLA